MPCHAIIAIPPAISPEGGIIPLTCPKGHHFRIPAHVVLTMPAAVKCGHEERHDVLCSCGWGILGCPESMLPHHCPLCGHDFEG